MREIDGEEHVKLLSWTTQNDEHIPYIRYEEKIEEHLKSLGCTIIKEKIISYTSQMIRKICRGFELEGHDYKFDRNEDVQFTIRKSEGRKLMRMSFMVGDEEHATPYMIYYSEFIKHMTHNAGCNVKIDENFN